MKANVMIIKALLFNALILLTNQLYATEYYLSNNGSDNNKGTSLETAWQTIGKLNATKLKPGDKIFLKNGDAFVGELLIKGSGTIKQPIVISSYGIGEKPILKGAINIKSFESYKSNIFQVKEENFIKTLFANNEMQIIARYPNSGFLAFSSQDEFLGKSLKTRDNGEGKNVSKIRMKNLPQPDDYWNGASIRYRPIDWEWGFTDVVNWKAGIMTVKDSCRYGFSKGYGFIMENKFEELDTSGEWLYDKKAKMLYIWSDTKPRTKIEGVVYDYGIRLAEYVSNIEIRNIRFEKYEKAGVFAPKNNDNIKIDSNDFVDIIEIGAAFRLISKNAIISNNTFNRVFGRAVSAYEPENMKVFGNTIKNIGLKPGYGITGVNGMAGIVIENIEEMKKADAHICLDNHIYNNYIDSIGHMGIRFDGTNSTCEDNIIKNCNFHMNDCGSIYSWTNAKPGERLYAFGNVISGNLIINSFGSNYATPGNGISAQGIYLDGVNEMMVAGNTVINANGAGILINAGSDNTVKDNLVYNNPTGIAIYNQANTGNKVIQNTMFPINRNQRAFNIMNWSGNDINYQTIDSNVVYSLTEKYIFTEEYLPAKTEIKRKNQYTWTAWKEKTGQDLHSKVFGLDSELSKFERNTIIYNDSFMPKEFDVADKFYDANGNKITNKIILQPCKAMILLGE